MRQRRNQDEGARPAAHAKRKAAPAAPEKQRVDASRTAPVHVFSQDRSLQHTQVHSPRGDHPPPLPDGDEVLAAKRRVLETGRPEDVEAHCMMPEGRALVSLHIDPTFAPDHTVDGIMCVAIDVGRIRRPQNAQGPLAGQAAATLRRYEAALRGSNVTMSTQDRALRYTAISNPLFGREVKEILGRTDDDIVPADSRPAIAALKAAALESGQPRDGEVNVNDGAGIRWYDLHIEPWRDAGGAIVGLTCAAVDVTERKEGEAHLRLLMRELTHRSKNLLAVIQAMARQTARYSESIDGFLERFGARLQALARSHDLLVQEEWHGVALAELVKSQLTYLDRTGAQIVAEGPAVMLRPEAAQSLGLALHELAMNALRYGALSTPAGKISIVWAWRPAGELPAVEIVWVERDGPAVDAPARRGFGSMVVERNLARALEADVDLTFGADGVSCRIMVPLLHLARPLPGET